MQYLSSHTLIQGKMFNYVKLVNTREKLIKCKKNTKDLLTTYQK